PLHHWSYAEDLARRAWRNILEIHVLPHRLRIALERVAVARTCRESDLVDVARALVDIDLAELEELFLALDFLDARRDAATGEQAEHVGPALELIVVRRRGIAAGETGRGGNGGARRLGVLRNVRGPVRDERHRRGVAAAILPR